jgi:CRISPR type III-B/RAMP module RAMP protein Cmr6
MIPLAKDTREAIGQFAERVENRALLFEKMVLSKNWGHPGRFNDANRFNVLRAATGGADLLREDREAAHKKSTSPRAKDSVREENAYKAQVAGALAMVPSDNPELIRRQVENANHLLLLLNQSYVDRVVTFVGQLGGRLLINMAGGVMENAGMALDRCFGLPYVPGSAVKGVTRNAALWHLRRMADSAEKRQLLRCALLAFGFVEDDLKKDFAWAAGDKSISQEVGRSIAREGSFKGLCSFLPAYPTSEENLRIVAEVLTPHPRATQSGDPRPLFFPAVEKGSEFGFACCMQRDIPGIDAAVVLAQVKDWMMQAVTGDGVGAKTGAGYGWFVIDAQAEERRQARLAQQTAADVERRRKDDDAAAARKAEDHRRAALSPEQVLAESIAGWNDQQLADFAKAIAEKPEDEQKAFCLFLSSAGKDRWKSWKKSPRWSDRLEPIRQAARRHGMELN